MYILFLLRVGLYISFLTLANARGRFGLKAFEGRHIRIKYIRSHSFDLSR
jgi:hypothetical protein